MSDHLSSHQNAADLDGIEGKSSEELKALYLHLTGTKLPKFIRGKLLRLAVAHAIAQLRDGGLDTDTQRRLDGLVRQIVPVGETPPPKPNKKIRSGTRLIREWQGQVHEVTVEGDSFLWNQERYRSLSEIARQITGTRWNGWVFFGLKKTGERRAVSPKLKSLRTRAARIEARVSARETAGADHHA